MRTSRLVEAVETGSGVWIAGRRVRIALAAFTVTQIALRRRVCSGVANST